MDQLISDARRSNWHVLEENGIIPDAADADRTHDLAEFSERFGDDIRNLIDAAVVLVGRVRAVRDHGYLTFFDVEDRSGSTQLFFDADHTDGYEYISYVDVGDIVRAVGKPMRTNSGDLALETQEFGVVSKSFVHVPSDEPLKPETRLRRPELAMWTGDFDDVLETRFGVMQTIREYLDEREFTPVETPILHRHYNGGYSDPFETEWAVDGSRRVLRITMELHLKTLVVGGYDRVYEIDRIFRNGDDSRMHYPERTNLELIQSYADYEDMMDLTESMVLDIVDHWSDGQDRLVPFEGEQLDFSPPWPRLTVTGGLEERAGLNVEAKSDQEVIELARAEGLECTDRTRGELISGLFKKRVASEIKDPVFVTDHPRETAPLCALHEDDDAKVERAGLWAGGLKLTDAFTEGRDPLGQLSRLADQLESRRRRVDSEVRLNDEFVKALGYGMPPAGGLAVSVDRLTMLLTDRPAVKWVRPFPMTV